MSLDGTFELCLTNYCLQVRVQAIRGLPLFCKDTPEHLSKIVDILVQLLTAGIEISQSFHQEMLIMRKDM